MRIEKTSANLNNNFGGIAVIKTADKESGVILNKLLAGTGIFGRTFNTKDDNLFVHVLASGDDDKSKLVKKSSMLSYLAGINRINSFADIAESLLRPAVTYDDSESFIRAFNQKKINLETFEQIA